LSIVISKLQSFYRISQLYSPDLLTQFSFGILFLNGTPSVTECVPISASPVAYCCTLKATRFARWMHLWPPIDGMKSGRRQGASLAPLPVAYGPVSGKEGRVRVLWSREFYWKLNRDCLVSWKNPLLLRSRYWLYRNRKIDFAWAFSSITKINTPHWIRE